MIAKYWMLIPMLGLAASAAQAQYTGPRAAGKQAAPAAKTAAPVTTISTVRNLIASAKDDTAVSVQGRIVRHLGGERYRFADSSGEIDLEVDAELWPANTPIDDKAEVRLYGEFDKDLVGDPKIEVDRLEKVK